MRPRAAIQSNGTAGTGFRVPAAGRRGPRAGKRPPVRVTIDGHTYSACCARGETAPTGAGNRHKTGDR